MWQRIKTAIILVIIVGTAMFVSRQPFFFLPLLTLGVLIASHEWTKLMPKRRDKAHWFVALVLIITLVSIFVPQSWAVWWGLSVPVWVLAAKWVKDYPAKENWYGKRLWTMGVIILVSAITAMYALWQLSAWWLLYVFVLVWCADSGAYFVGRKFGKTKLAPNVSPNKSLEGLYGGVATASLVAVGVGLYLGLDMATLLVFLALSAVVVGVSVLGDLFESMLKRRAGVKDSGTILPGHGGVLDRIDSLLSATPIFAFGILICDWLGIKFTPHFVMAYQLFGG
ncbi:phosphatidate cytidylyltransferase [Moraxella nasicaprae]|uniref:Phosphatidate cytidylyltransferase n=1 Tax=Moraxella nasicaprae TaxID=2904122 RepID=A0ABY6F4W2_9GAMM|nr:phosphatidate cytidylyltransferase [Moraxella nasicaprae]UXZ05131.1 phosphatidate cytidylyltransferase [Moraxella nasicaprae]